MMFALDAARAAREMHRILRPAGRVAVAVWASRQDNPWLGVLLDTSPTSLASSCPHRVPPARSRCPTPAISSNCLPTPGSPVSSSTTSPRRCGRRRSTPGGPATSPWQGPVVAILNGLDDATRSRLRDTVRAAVARYESNGALDLPGLAIVLTGRRP